MSPLAQRLRLEEVAPAGVRALPSALAWFVVASAAMIGAMVVAVNLTSSVWFRIIVGLALVLISTVALMLASDSIGRSLAGRLGDWDGRLQWFSTSVVALSVIVAFGAPISLLAPNTAGVSSLAVDLGIDLLLGIIGGVVAIGLILAVAAGLGELILLGHRLIGLEARGRARWHRPEQKDRRRLHQVLRGLALGSAGLLLSAAATAVVTKNNPTVTVDQPARQQTSFVLNAAVPLLLWFAGTAVVWWLFARGRSEVPQSDGEEPQRASQKPQLGSEEPQRASKKPQLHPRLRHGTHGSALAIALIIIAAWITAASVEHQARNALWSDPGAVPMIDVTDQQARLESPYLAKQFAPQMWLASGENWNPTEVTWYVGQNKVANVDPPYCNSGGCYQIPGNPPGSCDGSDPGSCAYSGADDPALYYRYKDVTDNFPHGGGVKWILIQYWVFYNYDSLQTWAINQWHQSDWEQVSVLIHRRKSSVQPAEVAFSEHCYGTHLPPDLVHWAGTHPIAYVGRGSHANYPRPVSVPVRQLRCSLGLTPRYLGVGGLFFSPAIDGSRIEIPLAYLIGLHDTADGYKLAPRPLNLVSLDATPAIKSFAGHWGLDNNLNPWGIARLRISAGPDAPQNQPAWKTPVSSMLCNSTWLSPQVPAFC